MLAKKVPNSRGNLLTIKICIVTLVFVRSSCNLVKVADILFIFVMYLCIYFYLIKFVIFFFLFSFSFCCCRIVLVNKDIHNS